MRPDQFTAWLHKLLPHWLPFLAVSGDDWHLYLYPRVIAERTSAPIYRLDLEGGSKATIRELVRWLRVFRDELAAITAKKKKKAVVVSGGTDANV